MIKREWGDYKMSGYNHTCATLANVKGVADDNYNRFRELPFWLRIGPINWKFNEYPYGYMLPNHNDEAGD